MGIAAELEKRKLPELLAAEEMKKILLDNEYGHIPDVQYEVDVSEPAVIEERFCQKTVCLSSVDMTIKSEYGSHTVPINRLLHNDGKKHPFFIFLNFSNNAPDKYYPVEEIAERGFDVISACYTDITDNTDSFAEGLAKVLLKDGAQTDEKTCGKLRIWAWFASRMLDYAQTLPSVDMNQAAVVGHSRLGKTALLAAMTDERFKFAFSNDSGCGGAAVARGNTGVVGKAGPFGESGETIKLITDAVGWWFCKKFCEYADTNIPDNFDQHYLIASIAPRFAYVASASMDDWADPESEFVSCVAASAAYEKMGFYGLVCGDEMAKSGDVFHEGRIGYHRTEGAHFLSRHDWNKYMDYMQLHKND